MVMGSIVEVIYDPYTKHTENRHICGVIFITNGSLPSTLG